MPFATQHLLRLPPSLRCQILSNASFFSRPLETNQHQARLLLRRAYAQARPPPKPTRRPFGPAPQKAPENVPPAPSPVRQSRQSAGNAHADDLCRNADTVLLYNSPNHTSYTLTSFLFAGVFFLGGINTALATKEPKDSDSSRPPMAWYHRASFAFGAIMFAVMGTMFVLAPTKMIRRVWLLKPQPGAGPYTFQIETKSTVPFKSGRTITTNIANVSLDRDVQAQDIRWFSVPLTSSSNFTAHYLNPPARESLGITGRLRALNASVLNTWPMLKQHVKRMFLREGIAYVHIVGEDGQWKLDLQGAEVLDAGRPVEKLMPADFQMARGVVPFLQRMFAAVSR